MRHCGPPHGPARPQPPPRALTEGVEEVRNFFDGAGDHLDVLAVGPVLVDLPLHRVLLHRHGRRRRRRACAGAAPRPPARCLRAALPRGPARARRAPRCRRCRCRSAPAGPPPSVPGPRSRPPPAARRPLKYLLSGALRRVFLVLIRAPLLRGLSQNFFSLS